MEWPINATGDVQQLAVMYDHTLYWKNMNCKENQALREIHAQEEEEVGTYSTVHCSQKLCHL